MEVKDLIKAVADDWQFNGYRYPELTDLAHSHVKARTFCIKHIMKHIAAETGDINRTLERTDHGKDLHDGELRIATLKLLKDALRLAEVVGLTSQEIEKHCEGIPRFRPT